jgi:hypothetical protein
MYVSASVESSSLHDNHFNVKIRRTQLLQPATYTSLVVLNFFVSRYVIFQFPRTMVLLFRYQHMLSGIQSTHFPLLNYVTSIVISNKAIFK